MNREEEGRSHAIEMLSDQGSTTMEVEFDSSYVVVFPLYSFFPLLMSFPHEYRAYRQRVSLTHP